MPNQIKMVYKSIKKNALMIRALEDYSLRRWRGIVHPSSCAALAAVALTLQVINRERS